MSYNNCASITSYITHSGNHKPFTITASPAADRRACHSNTFHQSDHVNKSRQVWVRSGCPVAPPGPITISVTRRVNGQSS